MKAFLQELAGEIYASHHDLSKVTVVFPNRRAALYFRKYLGGLITEPVFSPKLLTFEDFVSGISSQRVPDKLELIYRLHQSYKGTMEAEAETFDQFFMWGEMLLRDFDEADRYMIDAKMLFADLSNLKDLDVGLDYLSQEQITFLKNFWQGFDTELALNKKKFLNVWRKLYPLYENFNKNLSIEGLAYEGKQHRSVAEDLANGIIKLSYPVNEIRQLWFAGFNALTKAEEKIVSFAVGQGMAVMRWDTDQYYVNDESQEAGAFFRAHRQHLIFGKTFSSDSPSNFRQDKKVQLLGAAQPMGQVKAMAQLLANELKNGIVPEETVIILPDEKLLIPVLHSIASTLDGFNVTMGFPFSSSPAYNLIELLVELQISYSKRHFNYQQVQSILSHPYVVAAGAASVHAKMKAITKHNWVSVPGNFLASEIQLHAVIFIEAGVITAYLLSVLQELSSLETLDGIDQEYVFRGIQLLNRLKAVWDQDLRDGPSVSGSNKLKSFLRLFRQYAQREKIPFSGEPLKGLQVMGVLESRNLDFKNVFMLSLNEGVFPPSGNQGSYIPYSIRKTYGLPTPEHQGAIYAYLFYRAIQRSENVFLFYNSEPDVLGQGEMSRYLQQLIYESRLNIRLLVLHNPVEPRQLSEIVIHKNESVLQALERLNEGTIRSRGLSPSALNTYLECKLKFYFQYVARIREPKVVEEEIDPRILGNLLHRVMEKFYKRIIEEKKSNVIESADFEGYMIRIDVHIDESFIEEYYLEETKPVVYEGQRIVVREVVKTFAKQIIERDQQYLPFAIEALEQNAWVHTIKISHAPGFVVLGGTIDRVDRKENEVRVIDYKTGQDELDFRDVESLFSREGKRNKAAFQTMVYALIYKNNNLHASLRIVPGLLNRKNLFEGDFHFGLKFDKDYLNDATPLFPEFEQRLQTLLEEIFDPKMVFDQTEKEETCKICPFKEICYR
jgi:CRISPR/Cas system-associated exonuclease Cas4 (RecB family)